MMVFVLVVAVFTGGGSDAYSRAFPSAAACSAAEASARAAARRADPITPGAAYVVRPCFQISPEDRDK